MEELRKWEAGEEAKREAARVVQERLQKDRAEQLAERALRKRLVGGWRAVGCGGLGWAGLGRRLPRAGAAAPEAAALLGQRTSAAPAALLPAG
jgi:hypothetical protein